LRREFLAGTSIISLVVATSAIQILNLVERLKPALHRGAAFDPLKPSPQIGELRPRKI
jgi:hypothetical protein